ncbi:hypothetical protein [Gilvimarinus sp. DA14]|uniref:hypothetical protein n=1 Tax=Gilvimarinus sp. DA14 TaxID=2956798 RepID=UPI0020B79BE9|nr:hypothetical protein [Gilvimarinus sp. DA14]UTF61838.1 hypothetical protein NHM04_08615 [Gilvimarinus sp. DA14]
MKYLGGISMAMLTLLFSGLFALSMFDIENMLQKMPVQTPLWLLISIAMIFLCTKGAYYLFKYRCLFIKTFQFDDGGISILSKDGSSSSHSYSEFDFIIYRRIPKIFEIHFKEKSSNSIILMNNGQRLTNDFLELKQFLSSRRFNLKNRLW